MCWAVLEKKVTIFRKNLKIDNYVFVKNKRRRNKELKYRRKNIVWSILKHFRQIILAFFERFQNQKNSYLLWVWKFCEKIESFKFPTDFLDVWLPSKFQVKSGRVRQIIVAFLEILIYKYRYRYQKKFFSLFRLLYLEIFIV